MTRTSTSPPLTGKTAVLFGFIVGSWMLVDGVHRLITGDYVRIHNQLGPWAGLVERAGFHPMQFAPVFITVGGLWLIASNLYLFKNSSGAWWGVLAISVASLWYLGFGVILIAASLILLLLPQTRRSLR